MIVDLSALPPFILYREYLTLLDLSLISIWLFEPKGK